MICVYDFCKLLLDGDICGLVAGCLPRLIPHAFLILAVQGAELRDLFATLAGGGMFAMLLLVKSRTNGWIALFAALAQLLAAPVLVFAILFRSLAETDSGGDP